jgi:HPt (histidine-containing phosphotransfer) domain-containing protein
LAATELFIFWAQTGFPLSGDPVMTQTLPKPAAKTSSGTPGHGVNERPVDLVHLGVMTQGDGELEREVLTIFLAQAPHYLSAYHDANDGNGRRRAAHTLKGAARGIGAWRLAQAAENAETGANDDAITQETELVCDFIRRLG